MCVFVEHNGLQTLDSFEKNIGRSLKIKKHNNSKFVCFGTKASVVRVRCVLLRRTFLEPQVRFVKLTSEALLLFLKFGNILKT